MAGAAVTLEEQVACVKREIGLRLRVYPRWVETGKMRQATADQEIERMEAVRDTLTSLGTQPSVALVRHTLNRIADEVGGEIGSDIRAMDEARILREFTGEPE